FYDLVEVWSTDESTKTKHQIYVYCRYRDDIFIVFGSKELFTTYLEGMRQRASKTWTLKLEEMNDSSLEYLDMVVSKE
ncbi:MAG: hypothetical protein ACKPKO_31885, partial [Candidatus Fonsibacter sp.]